MSPLPEPYLPAEPLSACRVAEAPAVLTAVVRKQGYPMYEMPALMDGTFSHLADALAEVGVTPIGPAFSLHHRAPVDTADLEVGFPVDRALEAPLMLESGLLVEASQLPAGRVGLISYVGGYGGLGEAWGRFTQSIGDSAEQMTYPFWEFYVTEPSPEADPATMRTDLVSLLEPRA
ncbi:transcriptional regulator [Brachybacterium hainanense]|uniref:Transcriptional regulator n=1 Tax=Brachybacterium hainanense TaxID=1541174 RepID=A0ABV6RGP8_9MICO